MFEKCLNCLKEIVGRNMNIQGNSNKVSDRNEEHIIENWGKCDPCYKVPKNSAELYCSVLWKAEFASY